jgi:hypothetical protein
MSQRYINRDPWRFLFVLQVAEWETKVALRLLLLPG